MEYQPQKPAGVPDRDSSVPPTSTSTGQTRIYDASPWRASARTGTSVDLDSPSPMQRFITSPDAWRAFNDTNVTYPQPQPESRGTAEMLYAAALSGDVAAIKRLIEEGVDPNHQFQYQKYGSPLGAAAASGDIACAEALIQCGADVNMIHNYGDYGNAISAATMLTKTKMVEFLIRKEADMNMHFKTGIYGNLLAVASGLSRPNILELLLDSGANPNELLHHGNYGSALAAACHHNLPENVELLLQAGADPNLRLSYGNYGSALLTAIDCRSSRAIEELLKGGSVLGGMSGPLIKNYPIKGRRMILHDLTAFKESTQSVEDIDSLMTVDCNILPHNLKLSSDNLALGDVVKDLMFCQPTFIRKENTIEVSTIHDALQSFSEGPSACELIDKILRVCNSGKKYLDESMELFYYDRYITFTCTKNTAYMSDILNWICLAIEYSAEDPSGMGGSGMKVIMPHPDRYISIARTTRSSEAKPVRWRVSEVHEDASSCWVKLFKTPFKYLTPSPSKSRITPPGGSRFVQMPECKGLELEFRLMIQLSAVEYAVTVGEGIIFMGYSTALIPAQETPDGMIYWHLEVSTYPGQFKISDVQATKSKWLCTQDMDYLQSKRAILGWCIQANVLLGTDKLSPRVFRSVAKPQATTWQWTGANLQAVAQSAAPIQLGGQIGLSFSRINNIIRFTPSNNYLECLTHSTRQPIVLYDVSTRRAWLVPLLSVFHHMLLAYCEAFGNNSRMNLPPTATCSSETSCNSFDTLIEMGDFVIQESRSSADKLRVRDLIMKFSSNMAQMSLQKPKGSKIFGYEFMDIVTEPTRSVLEKVHLTRDGLAWSSLLSQVYCFFCSDIGDVILGSRASELPSPCNSLPIGKDLLATWMQSFLSLSEECIDSRDKKCRRLINGHFWQLSGPAFQSCQHSDRETCWDFPTFLQEIQDYQPDLKENGNLSVDEFENAALVFGALSHSRLSVISTQFRDSIYRSRSENTYPFKPEKGSKRRKLERQQIDS